MGLWLQRTMRAVGEFTGGVSCRMVGKFGEDLSNEADNLGIDKCVTRYVR